MRHFRLVLLILILIFAATLRLLRLGNDGHPLLWDEAALGYNAYSILKTGRDEYGAELPLILKSFGDYKPGLYAYAAIPSVFFFGLNEFSVRLPSALVGVLVVILIYLIANELFPRRALEVGSLPAGRQGWKLEVGISAALLAAFSPWLIHFSRGAWEANLSLGLTLLGIWSFLVGRRRPLFLVFSAVCFGLTFYAYQSAKLFTPLILLGLAAGWGGEAVTVGRGKFKLAVLIFGAILLSVILSLRGASGRLTVMSAFSYPRSLGDTQQISAQDGLTQTSLLFKIYHGQWLAGLTGVLERYFNHFSGRFLFFEGDWDNGRLGSPYVGQLYWLDLLFIVLGLAALAKFQDKKPVLFILYWTAISPLPAALSRDVVQAVRSLNLAVPLLLVAGLGLSAISDYLKMARKLLVLVFIFFFIFIYYWSVFYYLDSHFVHAPIISSRDWLYGYKEAVLAVSRMNLDQRAVFFTQKMGQPYIYVLFYNKVSPVAYQAQASLRENRYGDVGEVERFANYHFRNIYWPEDRKIKRAFFVGTEEEIPLGDIDPKQARVIEDIRRPDGTVAFRLVETL